MALSFTVHRRNKESGSTENPGNPMGICAQRIEAISSTSAGLWSMCSISHSIDDADADVKTMPSANFSIVSRMCLTSYASIDPQEMQFGAHMTVSWLSQAWHADLIAKTTAIANSRIFGAMRFSACVHWLAVVSIGSVRPPDRHLFDSARI